jgi:hypothetical protein
MGLSFFSIGYGSYMTSFLLESPVGRQEHYLLWCKALIHDNVIDNEVMGWSNLL